MALRSLGSTLLAKSQPGSPLRSKQEERAGGVVAREAVEGQPENIVRAQVQEPIERQVPQGSQKVISVAPTLEPRVEGTTAQPAVGVSGSVPVTPAPATGVRSGGGPVAAGRAPTAAPSAARPVSSGVNLRTQQTRALAEGNGFIAPSEVSAASAAPRNTAPVQAQPNSNLLGNLGGKVIGGIQSVAAPVLRSLLTNPLTFAAAAPLLAIGSEVNRQQQGAANVKLASQPVKFVPNTQLKPAPAPKPNPVQTVVRSATSAAKAAAGSVSNILRSLTKKR